MIFKICAVTGTRADYGLLKELLKRLQINPNIDLDLLVTGTHLSERFGNTQNEIIKDGFERYTAIPIPIDEDSKEAMAVSTGTALIKFSACFSEKKPNLIILLGDRYEILAAAIAAQFFGIPIAHISGGDVTEGAVDDAIRHSITKMSQLHFAGCEQSAKRIIQMGEQPGSVFNVGEPGVENCLKTDFLSAEELAESFQFPGFLGDFCMLTYHPVTRKYDAGLGDIKEIISAIDTVKRMSYIITMSNADAGGREINKFWLNESKKRKNWLVISSMGVQRYLSAMKYTKAVIGNSSSGIVEAPALGIPTVNIGDRQKGRMTAESVICCNPFFDDITKAINVVLSDEFQKRSKLVFSPFGDGTTSEKIEMHIMEYLLAGNFSTEKSFYNIESQKIAAGS